MSANILITLFSSFIVAVVGSVIVYNNARLNPKSVLHSIALTHPHFSPWARLLNCADEESFLELTGFNFEGFRALVVAVAIEDELHRRPRRGRPTLLNIHDQVGLGYICSMSGAQ